MLKTTRPDIEGHAKTETLRNTSAFTRTRNGETNTAFNSYKTQRLKSACPGRGLNKDVEAKYA